MSKSNVKQLCLLTMFGSMFGAGWFICKMGHAYPQTYTDTVLWVTGLVVMACIFVGSSDLANEDDSL